MQRMPLFAGLFPLIVGLFYGKGPLKVRHPMHFCHPRLWIPRPSKSTWFLASGHYGVATISRLLKILGLFCKRALQKRRYSAKATYDLKEPTNRSHPISVTGIYSVTHSESDTKKCHLAILTTSQFWSLSFPDRFQKKKVRQKTRERYLYDRSAFHISLFRWKRLFT